jgi:hypothetical protein
MKTCQFTKVHQSIVVSIRNRLSNTTTATMTPKMSEFSQKKKKREANLVEKRQIGEENADVGNDGRTALCQRVTKAREILVWRHELLDDVELDCCDQVAGLPLIGVQTLSIAWDARLPTSVSIY